MNLKLLLLKGLVNRHNTMDYDLTFGLDYEVPERRKRRSRADKIPKVQNETRMQWRFG